MRLDLDKAASKEAGAPEEPTSRMIDAGFEVLIYRYDPDESEPSRREVVREMYKAMTLARSADASR